MNSQKNTDLLSVDTIVVPANEKGFNEVFLREKCWHAVRISNSMLDKIKFVAVYQTAPVSAITYYAQVSEITEYERTDKYIIRFVGEPIRINPVKLGTSKRGAAPQSPRYTNLNRILHANSLLEVFQKE